MNAGLHTTTSPCPAAPGDDRDKARAQSAQAHNRLMLAVQALTEAARR